MRFDRKKFEEITGSLKNGLIPASISNVNTPTLISAIKLVVNPNKVTNKLLDGLTKIIGEKFNFAFYSSGEEAIYEALLFLRSRNQCRDIYVPAYTCQSVLRAAIKADYKIHFCDVSRDFSIQISKTIIPNVVVLDQEIFGIRNTSLSELIERSTRDEFFVLADLTQALQSGRKLKFSDNTLYIGSFGSTKPVAGIGGGFIASKCSLNRKNYFQEFNVKSWAFLISRFTSVLRGKYTNAIVRSFIRATKINQTRATKYSYKPFKLISVLAIASILLKKLPETEIIRKINYTRWESVFSDSTRFSFFSSDEVGNAQFFPIICREGKLQRDNLQAILYKFGISAETTYAPLNQGLPQSVQYHEQILLLPTHAGITSKTWDRILNKSKLMDYI
jgi:dTDP-4-amino-4,6-dideoxygalactose transaminase